MPHSVSSEAPSPAEDSILPDAPAEPLHEQDDSGDDTQADATTQLNGGEVVDSVSRPQTDEVRLEDLFNDDDDDDEEFPTSGATDVKMANSPPQAPMYVSPMGLSTCRAANVD
jgi:DNA primase small subunit